MALKTRLSNNTVNAQANALNALCSNGTIEIYDGVQPTTADTAISGNTLGVILTFSATAFSVNNGVMTANSVTAGIATASITPTWGRIKASSGSVIMDISAGTAGSNLLIDSITNGALISCSSIIHTINKETSGL